MNNSLDQENKRLMDRLEVKMETECADPSLQEKTQLARQINDLQEELLKSK